MIGYKWSVLVNGNEVMAVYTILPNREHAIRKASNLISFTGNVKLGMPNIVGR